MIWNNLIFNAFVDFKNAEEWRKSHEFIIQIGINKPGTDNYISHRNVQFDTSMPIQRGYWTENIS
ncbi:hypothetical protein CRE_29107 [Caenorhabditis remanei]|uniref:Uncharacterized protein n=1 Tax=Caenorhabditis remanei TaxID=31234 RepID=E3N4J9_CAERE|nr:hypothetical protein CRE_29107 [Caenorhabditis remanei]